MQRREFLGAVIGASGATVLQSAIRPQLPPPSQSGIEHIVVLMMENRSFDHFLGWLPNANGTQAGLTYPDPSGAPQPTHELAPDFTGCGFNDPDHSYDGARIEYDNGLMDGFLLNTANDTFSIGYYGATDLKFLHAFALNYTTCDNFFPSILGPTFPNRIFAWCAQTDRLDDSFSFCSLPTIFDSLKRAGIDTKYYYNNIPVTVFFGLKYLGLTHTYDTFLQDAANGTLPAISFVDPTYTTLDILGGGNDDHPHADIRRGDAFVAQTFHALANSPNWPNTVFVLTFDEWGGFFDHVTPPRAAAPNNVDPDIVDGKTLLGIRVPVVVASPWSRGKPSNPRVNHLTYDHTSVLKMIEWRYGLAPLTSRDASNDIQNLALALNFSNPITTVPALPSPPSPGPTLCLSGATSGLATARPTEWEELRRSPLAYGWNLPQ
jgi:phospholipase C